MIEASPGEIRVLRRLEEEGGEIRAVDLTFSEETYIMGLRGRGWVDGFRGHGTWRLTDEGRNFLKDIPPLDLQDH